MIPYGKQDICQSDIDAVTAVLESNWLTQGPFVEKFESSICHSFDAKYATATNSATSALHLTCLALGLGKGDILWSSPISFVASTNCALYCGAEVDFVDINPRTYNLDAGELEKKLKESEKNNKLPKILVVVHFAGQPCEMEKIHKLAKIYHFSIIEDASHAIGAIYNGSPIGASNYSDATVFSFHPVKIITTGEGGMVVTNQKNLHDNIQLLRSHGITRDQHLMDQASHGSWYYQQIALGFNYRLTDIQAALGISQLNRINQFLSQRRQLAERYTADLSGLPIILPYEMDEVRSSWHLYVIRLDLTQISKTRKEVFDLLRSAGIGVQVHYIPIHLQPYYQNMGFRCGQFPEAEQYYAEAISLPLYPSMTEAEQDKVISQFRQILQ